MTRHIGSHMGVVTMGRIVKYVGESGIILTGSIGKVTGQNIMGWPTVYFPKGTCGPHAEFAFSDPTKLVDVADADIPTALRIALGV